MNILIVSIIGLILGVLLTTASAISVNTYRENEKYKDEHTGTYIFVIFILIIGILVICASIGGIAVYLYGKFNPTSVLDKFNTDELGNVTLPSLTNQQPLQSIEEPLSQLEESRIIPREVPREVPRAMRRVATRPMQRITPRSGQIPPFRYR